MDFWIGFCGSGFNRRWGGIDLDLAIWLCFEEVKKAEFVLCTKKIGLRGCVKRRESLNT